MKKTDFPKYKDFTGEKAREIIDGLKPTPSLQKMATKIETKYFTLFGFIRDPGRRPLLSKEAKKRFYDLLKEIHSAYESRDNAFLVINKYKKRV